MQLPTLMKLINLLPLLDSNDAIAREDLKGGAFNEFRMLMNVKC